MKDECFKEGWVKTYRCIMESSIWKNANYLKIFLWCLMKANHEEDKFPFNGKDITINRGQFVTGRKEAAPREPVIHHVFKSDEEFTKFIDGINKFYSGRNTNEAEGLRAEKTIRECNYLKKCAN